MIQSPRIIVWNDNLEHILFYYILSSLVFFASDIKCILFIDLLLDTFGGPISCTCTRWSTDDCLIEVQLTYPLPVDDFPVGSVSFLEGTPLKINMVHLKITCLKRKLIFQITIFRFHVDLPGCIPFWLVTYSVRFNGNPNPSTSPTSLRTTPHQVPSSENCDGSKGQCYF